MSRFTSSPFHKPSPFQFPHALPSPPETQAESIAMASVTNPSAVVGTHDQGINESMLGISSPDLGSRVRKSSIAYNISGLRETKDRSVQRPAKPLVIVIPPPNLIPSYAQASTSVTVGPPSRLLQGTIMPLLPSMFGQLTAIAKEFNFPSTAGLCLYMRYVEDGIAMTPRISEESWHGLWAYFTEPALLPHERKPLIAGKIEFDIDLRLARWYTAWLSNILREVPESLPQHFPSTAPSLAHFRGESKTTYTEGRHLDDEAPETSSTRPLPSASLSRHAPRKLSLVERFDSTKSDNRLYPLPVESLNPPPLSPIVQEDEPKSARHDLDSRVISWRATALTSTHKLSAKGQPSLDPPNLPNDIPIQSPSLPVEEEAELNLADYAWSISSHGPASNGELSPLSWSRVSSIDLAHRLVGSVCSTPSICTSFGPADYESLVSPISWGRVPSVHMGDRLAGSVATTPSVCTSFGPVDYDPLFPIEASSLILSPDIADRFLESGPPSPFTATSWGAPSSFPSSPSCFSVVSSVGLAERVSIEGHTLQRYLDDVSGDDDHEEGEIKLFNPWPFTERQTRMLDGSPAEMIYSEEPTTTPEQLTGVWRHAWPYTSVRTPTPVQEEDVSTAREPSPFAVKETSSLAHPQPYTAATEPRQDITPWGHAWPYNKASMDQSPTVELPAQTSTPAPSKPESVRPWGHAWPYNTLTSNKESYPISISSSVTFGYPYLTIYTPVYPNLEIYPPALGLGENVAKERYTLSTDLPFSYPYLKIYQHGYPHNLENIYPSMRLCDQTTKQDPVEYPYFDLYPAKDGPRYAFLSSVVRTPAISYPDLQIYPAVHGYPLDKTVPLPLPPSTRLPSNYPVIDLYPAVYPYFDLYPSVSLGYEQDISHVARPIVKKVGLHIYPPVRSSTYPDFDLYPAMMVPLWHPNESKPQKSSSGYPRFDLYPAVYPHFDLYPWVGTESTAPKHANVSTLTWTSAAGYPYFDLYPTVYPHFNLYPSQSTSTSTATVKAETSANYTRPQAVYPFFNLYPAVYPHLDLYLPLPGLCPPPAKPKHREGICTARATSRLTHSELHAIVMMEQVGSARGFHASQLSFDQGHASPISPQLNRSPSGIRSARFAHLPSPHWDPRGPSMAFSSADSSFLYNPMTSVDQTTTPLRKSLSLRHRESPRLAQDATVLKTLPQRRESLVSQRVKAYAASMDAANFKETVSKFPMPPTPPSRGFPPLPRVPADRF